MGKTVFQAGPVKTLMDEGANKVAQMEKDRIAAMPPELPMPEDPGSASSRTRGRKKTVRASQSRQRRGRMSTILSQGLG